MQWIILLFHVVIAPIAIAHALLYKRDSRAALGWIGISLVFPIAGPLLYFFFGVNRQRARALEMSGSQRKFFRIGYERGTLRPPGTAPPEKDSHHLAHVGWSTTSEPLLAGNRVELLENGDAFYPRLLADIRNARRAIRLSSYIFSGKGIGAEICDALVAAASRGVDVHVLVDGLGTMYSLRSAERRLRDTGVKVARFHPLRLFPPDVSLNLRNHRKLVVIDGETVYFGGMNIDDRHFVAEARKASPHADLHFRAEGPISTSLDRTFLRDWHIATGETLSPLAAVPGTGDVKMRAIEDGPDESMDRLSITLLGIISGARHRVRVVTPYFIPSRELLGALQAADVRGVDVKIILPMRSNLRFADWATRHLLWELLQWGVEVYFVPPPFVHSKLVTVDDDYVLGGSANIDPRSLRLNFEIGVEMFDRNVATHAAHYIDTLCTDARQVTLEEMDHRSLPARFRDGFFWLFSAYL
jgi:cardiolipin synthase